MTTRAGKTRSPGTVLEQLRKKPEGHARGLADAMVSDALARSPAELIDPEALASAVAAGIRSMADQPELEDWIRDRASEALEWAYDGYDGTVEEHVGPETAEAVRRVASTPFRVDPALVRAVLGHRKVRAMLREGLENLLTSFGRSLLSALPSGERTQAFAGIFDVAKNMFTVVRNELNRQLEGRVEEFVEETIDRGIEKWAARLSSRHSAERFAKARGELADILLEQPVRHYLAIPRTADPAAISAAVTEESRALAEWEGLEGEFAGSLGAALEPMEDESLERLLEGSGLVECWRGPIEERLTEHLARLFESEPFGEWLSKVEAGKAPARKKR